MAKAKKEAAKKADPKGKAPGTKKPVKKGAKKGGKAVLTRTEIRDAQRQRINANFKAPVIQSADEFENVFLVRRPTGITSLDLSIAGGLPAGGLTEFIGASSVGKDYLVNRVVANLQTTYGKDAAVCFCMTEMHYDKRYAKKCGVRVALTKKEILELEQSLERKFTPDEMLWAQDHIGTIDEVTAGNAEQLLEIAAQVIQTNTYQVVVINSIGALLTKAEETAEGGLEDKHYSGAANTITAFCHRMHMGLNHRDALGQSNLTTVIGINQYRDNVGRDAKYNPMKAAGGNAWKHAQLLSIGLRAGTKLKATVNGVTENIGKEINWEIRKQKAGGHDGAKGMYPFYFDEHGYHFGAEVHQDLITMAVRFGIVVQAGSWLSYEGDGYSLKSQGKEAFAHAIAGTEGAFDHLKAKVFQASGVHFLTKGLDE